MTAANTVGLEKATLYDRHRLPYAPAAVAGLLGHTGPAPVVADIGAGTGQLARLLAPRSARVYAVEPDPAMRQVGATALADFGNITILNASAEQTTLPDKSIDLIVIGNAYHRFQPEAGAELRRILRPGGWAALFAHAFTNRAYPDLLYHRLADLPNLARRMERAWHRPPLEALFGAASLQTLSDHQATAEDWNAFFGAACSGIEAPERSDPEFAAFEAINREVFQAFAVAGRFTVEYEPRVTFGQPASRHSL